MGAAHEFDAIVIVDWSAQAAPKRGPDSIWSYLLLADGSPTGEPVNHPTRSHARDHLLHVLQGLSQRSVLLGCDFPFGYPAGFAHAAGIETRGLAPWAALWAHLAARVTDDERNRNNRWAIAAELNERLGHHRFWGTPAGRAGLHLPTHRPTVMPPDRVAEARLRRQGKRPFSPWQLLGAGSVGSQSLTGVPVLQSLRHHPTLAHRVAVWPFETGLAMPGAQPDGAIVMAEVWPSSVEFNHIDHPVKDARQVMALAQSLATDQRAGRLVHAFQPALTDEEAAVVVAEEGWVLGLL